MTQRVSKRFTTILIVLGSLVGLPLVVYSVLVLYYARINFRVWVWAMIAGLLLLLASYLVWIPLISVMQRAVREKGAHPIREGFGNTLGMLIWTTHWAYIALRRFPEDYSDYAERHQLSVPQLSRSDSSDGHSLLLRQAFGLLSWHSRATSSWQRPSATPSTPSPNPRRPKSETCMTSGHISGNNSRRSVKPTAASAG